MAMFWKICVVVILALCSQVFAQIGKRVPMGGWSDVSENNQHAQNALKFAKDEYNKDRNEDYITEISRIIRMRKQVVAGMKYSMEVEAKVSPCSESEFTKGECQDQQTTKKRCSFEVLIVAWENRRELRKGYCSSIRN
ncbi:cystatin-C-like isoform X3 [Bufo gargarizans]|uniref:cystatin-C-like isoform X3 n=1 Tax=Bufo gargarizans TaxID=30331 RepID=UPI001CF153B5|nr:cystatin-C-like isoform X3 [Bufo gargarizans]